MVKFQITDDLPDLADHVMRDEILLLLTIAPSLSPYFAEAAKAVLEPTREEVPSRASRSLRPRQHAETG